MKRTFLYLFVVASVGEIISTLLAAPLLEAICRPAPMIALGLYYWASQKERNEPVVHVVVIAIIFSCLGNVILLFQQPDSNYFIISLAAFLFARIFYIFSCKHHQSEEASKLQTLQKIRFALPIVLGGVGLVTILYNYLGYLIIPVILYSAVLTYMVLVALFRYSRTNTESFVMVFGGAIFFMMSDCVFAINKFIEHLPLGDFWVRISYISAQFLIVQGLLKHVNGSRS
jgi:uncharacterized membrane protein YhhN